MSERIPEYLCLDIGNSRVKYAMVTKREVTDTGILTDQNHLQQLLVKSEGVYIASVGQTEYVAELIKVIQSSNCRYELLSTSTQVQAIAVAYNNPAKLGLDRWLAMLGARRFSSRPFAVLDIGTAITCDFVDVGGQHLGGWICPGIQLMRQSLAKNTARVTTNQQQWYVGDIGKDTEECVDSGCLVMAKGIIDRADLWMKNQFSDYDLFICGGDCDLLLPEFVSGIRHIPDIIFYGMMQFISEKA
ncbi:type III pantothenate kinase [Lacimicrobium alkaliphilum]|uniref:Type III pantothenate kinase n=1 Tax=Lacimicrobium alkaliphilum TaxID=1526571 RepID=A0ABQ1RVF7_9ALTE|nr:type III pantothenate kinase [Lacimicrobium alkaliphilum]GGD79388.1 type III pantothenate kinase [Lacimicrobium alkaliphilum]